MKILAIRETNPFADSTASNNRFLTLAEGLVSNGCQIDLLICSGFYHKSENNLFDRSGTFNKIYYKYLLPVNFSNFLTRQFFYRIFPNVYLVIKIREFLKGNRYDFVWLTFGKTQIKIGISLFKYEFGAKYFHEQSEYSWIGLSGKEKLHKKYLNEFLPHIDVLSIMTSALLNYYKDFVGKQTKVIHLPMTVDFSRFQTSIADNQLKKPYIAYCGSVSNAKDGVDILIKAFIRIMDRFPRLHLYIAGPFIPEQDYIKQRLLIKEATAENRVTYLGHLTREEMPAFLSNASVLTLARPESKQAEGGFPTKLGEYLATGKPVCVTCVGEISNYLKDNVSAFIAKPGSVESFADALHRALACKDACIVGASGMRVAFEHFNKDIQARILYKFLLQNK